MPGGGGVSAIEALVNATIGFVVLWCATFFVLGREWRGLV